MIPKKIHYCWFGGNPLPESVKMCIASWEKKLPDYEIVEWNENTFDISKLKFTEQAASVKKWAFVSDVARLNALYEQGGIYMDTDVEVLKSLDEFLTDSAFTGFEVRDCVMTAVLACEKGNGLVKEILDYYINKNFINEDGSLNEIPNPVIFTEIFHKYGLKDNGKKQVVNGRTVYPEIYFSPNNFGRIFDRPSNNSYTIHHFDGSWRSKQRNMQSMIFKIGRYGVGVLRNIFGTANYVRIFGR